MRIRATVSFLALASLSACGTRTGLLQGDASGMEGGVGGAGGTGASGGGATGGTGGEAGGPGYTPVQLALGSYHTCSVRVDGRLSCWGGNQKGQLGDGTLEPRAMPSRVDLPPASIVSLAAGFRHTCAALVTGEVHCWGENTDGQVFLEEEPLVLAPFRVPLGDVGVGGIVNLAAGEYHTCAALSDGRLICWGSDRQGQLGIGAGYQAPPTEVPLPGPVKQVTAGDFFTCAIVNTDGADWVYCFGQNFHGQLGDGTFVDRKQPVQTLLGEPVQRIDAGGFFVLASLVGDGLPPLVGWGENSAGQLGPDLGEEVSVPAEVTPSWNLAHWSAGLMHACAVRWHDGAPWETLCWGSNGRGQLGDGTTVSRAEPKKALVDFDAILVEAGLLHTCAEALGGGCYCWGSNEYGQLGDGTTADSTVPVAVQGL